MAAAGDNLEMTGWIFFTHTQTHISAHTHTHPPSEVEPSTVCVYVCVVSGD